MTRTATLLGLLVASGACGACRRGAPGEDDQRAVPQIAPLPPVDERCDPSRSRQCIGNDVVACEPDGTLGRRLQACHEGCDDGECVATCADDGAQLIYLVDDANDFMSFDPRKLPRDPFQRIGRLDCGSRHGEPFSMSVDRHGVAWVVYQDGALFKVSIADARCRPTHYQAGSGGFLRFGMGFVSDQPGGKTEKLFVAADDGSRTLATIDTASGDTASSLAPRAVGALPAADEHNPELTGTGDARLFGFYPATARPAFVQEIDRATAAPRGPRWSLGKAPLSGVTAYAFAQWAGVFYVFVTSLDDEGASSSTVRTVESTTGAARVVLDHLPYHITGAGVSTCAPARDQ